jgi:hypothetical protein
MTNRREPLTADGQHSARQVSPFRREGHNSLGKARFQSAAVQGRAGRCLALPLAVACRIEVRDENNVRTVSVAGRLADAHVPDLLMACREVSGALRLDLTDVLSADAIAIEALRRIRDGGAQLVGVPKYIQLKLDSLAPGPQGL